MGGRTLTVILLTIITQASSNGDKRPQFTMEPPSRVLWPATRGAHATCRATGHPTPDIHWVTSEGQLLTTIPGLRHILPDGRLVVGSRRSLLDAGSSGSAAILRCRASNRAGTVLSRPVLLQPVEDNILSHTARQLMPAKVGGTVVLRCEVSPQAGVVEVSWLQDGLPLASGYLGADSRWVSGASGLLLGSSLTQGDIQAEYACLALDTASPTIKLTTDDSSWLENIELNSVEAKTGDSVVLPCILKHNTALTVTWQRQEPTGTWISTTEGAIRGTSLFLPSVRLELAGRYACSGGSETAAKVFIRLVVYEPLSVNVEPNPLLVGTGGTGHFNCSVSGGRGTGVTFSWQHEGRPLHPPQSKLAIGPVRPHHGGLYQCTAYDHSESAVGNAELIVADRPPRLLSSFNEATARIGQTIVLRCSATGVPSPRIFWTLDDRPLPSAPDKYSVNTRAENVPGVEEVTIVSTLNIAVRTADEGGRYGCNATNSKGSQAHHARLNVFGPPNIRYLSAIHVKTDTDVTIFCPYSGYPIKDVLWRREDGTPVEPSLDPVDDRGILRLPAIRSSLGGSYTCEVRGESGELARRSVRIEVHKTPKVAPFQFPEELEVGDSTQATCSLVSGDKPIQFTWQKDNLPIPSTLKVEQKNMDFFSLLIIQHLSSVHTGEYTCKASNEFGSVTHTASLMVKEAPLWVWRAQNTSVSAGAALMLPCSAKGQPTPRITWEFSTDGENWRHVLWSQSESPDMSGGSILSDGTVWLRSTAPEHEGWYRCTARAQHAFLHHVFYLDVREPPRLLRSGIGGETRWVVRGSTARLTCIVRGEPEVHVHWTHDSRPLAMHGSGGVETRDTSNGVITSEITIIHTGPEHAGEYRCMARNLYGSGELVYKLFVKERPSIPEEVRISEVWPRKARITWRISRGALVSHYSLQYKALNRELNPALDASIPALLDSWDSPDHFNVTFTSSEVLHVALEGPGRAGALVSGLTPDTRYALRLAAFNDVGGSAYTSPLHFTTREEAPGGAPRDVTIRALRPHELHVSWQPPPRETWHGTLLGYTIRWWEVTDGGEGPGADSGAGADAASATLRALKPATRYGMTVRAHNAAGPGPPAPPRYAHTMDSPPTAGPESLTCMAGSSTSLKVNWRPPPVEARGGLITHYTLQYTRRDGDPLVQPQDHHLRLQGEEATVSRLSSYAEYEIRVRAHNAAGDGPLSAPQLCRTDEDVPSAPGGIKLIALSERSLRASWLPPPEPNGRITHYNLYIKDLSGTQQANVTRVSACTESEGTVECMRSIRGVRPGRTYEAWVRAATVIGEGPPSASVNAQTTALAPARISSFGGITVGAAGASLALRCVVGGAPAPAKRWLRAGAPLHTSPPFHLDGDALLVRNLELSHADNYTCLAENPHGSDSVTWRVVVLRPPAPPSLALLEARPRELELELRPAARSPGHAQPKGYSVHWRLASPEGEWRTQSANIGPVLLSGLRCGSAYRAYAAAGGAPGPELAVRTSGGPPNAPPDSRWIAANATHARFDTSEWSAGGCGRAALKLEWAGAGAAHARDLPTGGTVVAGGLTPGSRYRVIATASNEAGQTREVYEFSTTPAEGSFAEEVDAPFPATSGELALLLTLCAALSLAALTILAILLRRKRNDVGVGRVSTHAEKLGCGTYRAPAHPTPKLPPEPPDVYEISPYATFAEATGGARAYTLQLRALAPRDDDAAPVHEETCVDACDAQRRRRRRQRHYCPDHGRTLTVILLTIITQASSNGDKRPQFTMEPPSRVLWPATRGAHATCRATGHPTPDIHWVTSEGQLLTTIPGLRHILPDGRLVVGSRRSLLDAGSSGSAAILRCRASNRAGTVLSRPVLLQPVEDNILSHTARQLMPAKVGGTVVLRCEVSPQAGVVEVSWLQDGLPLASGYLGADSRWVSGASGLLLGSSLTQGDIQAEYACLALDTASPTIKLTTDDSSWLENIELNSVEAKTGDSVVLPCILKHNTALTVTWQRQEPTGTWISTTEGAIRGTSLFLPSVRLELAGRYACSGGSETAAKVFIRLVVYEPLSVNVEPNPLLVGTGGTGHFNCSVSGGRGTGVTFSWQHEGRPLHPPQSKLAIGPVRPHHGGLYQCTAYDHSESAVGNAELIVADRPPRLLSSFNEATARIGQTIVLRCSATGVPSPRIFWTLDDRPLPSAPDKYSVNTRAENVPGVEEVTIVSTLNIAVRTADEGGRYGCNATNSKGSQAHHARLNVFGPPNIRYLSAIHVKTDTDVTIFCPYSGYPVKDVLWRREDGTPVENSLDPVDDRGILRLPAIRSSLGGSYTCEVRGESGELARRSVRIEVHKTPKVVPFQFPDELEVGDSTQATCSLVSGDKPIQFTWQKDNLPIPSTLKVEQKNMDFFSLLIIQHLSSVHTGEYTCKASNEFGSVTHTASLMVKEAPLWVWRAQNTSVSAGAALMLPCSAKGQPTPRITWEFSTDGENWRHVLWSQSESPDMSGGSILSDGTVWLRAAAPEHEGWYRCTARAQHAFLHHVFYLDVREPPRLLRSGIGGETRWVVRGSTARLTCIVRGEPEVHVHWTHDSRPLAMHGSGGVETRDTSNGVITSEITIIHTGPEHAGEYRCMARNLYGSGELVYKLFVKERPSIPEEVRISEVWPRKARITWRISRGALVSHYSLQYKALNRELNPALDASIPALLDSWDTPDHFNVTFTSSEVLHVALEGPGRAGALVSGLTPDTRYALRLAAFNDVGGSAYTLPLHFTTREEAPGGAPRDVTIRALRPHELHVSWQPPPRETWHGTLLGYTIRWWEVTDGGEGPGADSGAGADAASATLRALKPATRYGVTVRAHNAAGPGPPAPPRYAHTMDSPPTAGPESLTCMAGSSTSLKVNWRPPPLEARGGLITHYTLQYTRRDGDPLVQPQDHHLRLQGEEATVSRLSSYAEYEIRVRAHNAAGDGPLSAPQLCRTDEDVPSAPGGIKLIALSERSLRASWLPPPEPNGRITHYNLYIKDLSGTQQANVTRVSACTESEGTVECMRSIRGVRPGRTYEAWVRAATVIGEGPPSASVNAQTTALAPARISSFGGITVGAAGASLALRCVVGGAPAPAKRWLRAGAPLHTSPPFHLDGDALLVRNLELSHADNYTCLAENPHGSDSVTWRVVVLRPPAPPSLALLEARPRELELELRPAARSPGHAQAKGYSVHWRLASPEGEWRTQSANIGPVLLSGLRCGSAYRAYAAAGGAPGPELAVRTSGGPPNAPPDSRWIAANTTHARFDTSEWSSGGCGRAALKLEWAGAGAAHARDLPTGGTVVAGGLTPGSRYRVIATASNEAGQTREVYEFSTTPAEGSFAEEVDAPFPATSGELALLLTLCAALSLAALTILAILLRRKRNDVGVGRVSTHAEKLGCGTYRAPAHPTPKLPPEPPDVYEISPYATFAEATGGARAYTLQLRALAPRDDDAAPVHEETCVDACDAQRRRRRRQRHYCPDHGCSQDSGS